jgi:hypothetical protein
MRSCLCCLLTLLAVPALAQAPVPDADLQRGIRQVNNGELDAAVLTLDGVIRALAPAASTQGRELAQAHLYKGVALVGLLQEEPAKASFREALRHDPALRLAKGQFPDRVVRVFEAARKGKTDSVMKRPTGAPKKAGIGTGAILAIAGGVLAAGGTAAAVSGGGGTQNGSPVVGPVSASPSGPALVAATAVVLSVSATDPDGDTLAYNWNFGDGGSASGQTVTHVFNSQGTFTVQVTVADGNGGSAISSTTVTARTLSGCWIDVSPSFKFTLTQNGAQVTGTSGGTSECAGGPWTVQGTVSNVRGVALSIFFLPNSSISYFGEVDPNLDILTLRCSSSPCGGFLSAFTLRRQ